MSNTYSDKWFDVFLRHVSREATEAEVAFLRRHLPQPRYHAILDLCCGNGRHARLLAAAGYRVTGIDNNANLVREAAAQGCGQTWYETRDMRRLSEMPGGFDGVINLWQSFGYFDEDDNLEVLRQIRRKLSPRGRLIIDIYHRGFLERHQGQRQLDISGHRVHEQTQVTGNRLHVLLTYVDSGETDRFEWRVYYPEELADHLRALGFRCSTSCTDFDQTKVATAERPRMQLVFEAVD